MDDDLPLDATQANYPFLMFLIVGLFGLAVTVYFAHQSSVARNWPTTSGHCHIAADQLTRFQLLRYEYDVAETSYETKCYHVGIQPVEPTVTVAYDPVNPAHAVVKEDNMPILLMSGLLCGGISVASFFAYISGATVSTVPRTRYWRY